MSEDNATGVNVLPIEFFAAKDHDDLFMAVPRGCGLREADTLRVNNLSMVAIKNRSILPIDLPLLTESLRTRLMEFAANNQRIPVGEFTARGVVEPYFLNLVIV